jgi:Mg2+-importing ATPase
METFVASGFGLAVIVITGKNTEYGKLADNIRFRPPETAFEIGVKEFSQFLLKVTLILVIIIFAVNTYLHKPIIESLLFSLALAVGLTPQLLPAIISVNLAHGAKRMLQKQVIVKRLPSIENFGQMNILCSDKTGTITTGVIQLKEVFGINESLNPKISLYAFLNAHFQTGYTNLLDNALLTLKQNPAGWEKIDEIPYDFIRKRLSVILKHQEQTVLIAKGAFLSILDICTQIEMEDGLIVPIEPYRNQIQQRFEKESKQGFRILGLGYALGNEEKELTFLGFISFFDPIKPDIHQVIQRLKTQGVSLKIITGDHPDVALFAAKSIGLTHSSLITGDELKNLNEDALIHTANEKNIFAGIDPQHKESIIAALRKYGHVVGYLGDGINDIAALHSADVGIAVDSSADIAKEAADIILLKKDLSVLSIGIEEGRKTFLNMLKYIYMATSANFGNMFSMAGASLFLSFLPLLPKQVLLTNFFSDLPEMALATDHVDVDTLKKPIKWDLPFIRRFMLLFGFLNSFADYMTFGVLLFFLNASESLFRSAWFVENIISAALIVLVIRTRKPFFKSAPSKTLITTVFLVTALTPFIPLTPLGRLFGLSPIPLAFYIPLTLIIIIYIASVEIAKHFFFKQITRSSS